MYNPSSVTLGQSLPVRLDLCPAKTYIHAGRIKLSPQHRACGLRCYTQRRHRANTWSATQCSVVPSSSSSSPIDSEDKGVELPSSKSPRRTMLLSFTCNQCGGRTERLVNPVAVERGLVIVQCSNCEVWHKIADAKDLIQEFDFRDKREE